MENDFLSDPNCIAVYNFESGARTTDSQGSNTLTETGTLADNTTDYKQGSCSLDTTGSGASYIDDTDLEASFPFKSTDSTKKITVTGWFYFASLGTFMTVLSKWDTTLSERTAIPLRVYYSGGPWQSYIGKDGGTGDELLYQGGTPVTGRWYHFGFTFDDTDKSWTLTIWDDTAGSKVVDTGGIATNNISVDLAAWVIGGASNNGGIVPTFNGYLDEFVFFNDIKTSDDIDAIRAGTYSAATTSVPTTTAPTTLAATTLAPTTLVPTTVAPTTLAPTTTAPTTLAATTGAPTTLAPTTESPTTVSPTTVAPTTVAPTTSAPTSAAPTTVLPTTVAPTTVVPTTLGPTTSAPTTSAPTTAVPTTAVVTTPAPTTTVPTTVVATTVTPTTLGPTTLPPSTMAVTTLVPTTAVPPALCLKPCDGKIVEEIYCFSSILDDIICLSPITEEIVCYGNLC